MKELTYPPLSFLEIDDGAGGRKVAAVALNGVTAWDSWDTETVTPIPIRLEQTPVLLGNIMDYVATYNLRTTYKALLERSPSVNDALFFMRCLHYLVGKGFSEPTDIQLNEAEAHATEQNRVALEQHRIAKEVMKKEP